MKAPKRQSKRRHHCPITGKEYVGFQWGGHRRICPCRNMNKPAPGSDFATISAAVARGNAPEKDCDRIVKTVRSYVAGLDEEHAKLTARLNLLKAEMGKIEARSKEITAERERIVSSMREIK